MNALGADLKRLPEPAVPEGLTASITARIARVDEERADGDCEPPRAGVARASRDRVAWVMALAGVAISIGAQAYRLVVGESTLDLTSLRISGGMGSFVEALTASPAVAVLGGGLLLYLAGLFASLRTSSHAG